MTTLRVQGTHFVDEDGRSVSLRGINISGDSKLPKTPDIPSHRAADFWEHERISFVGRPFELAEADEHLSRITSWGFNTVRFIITWEAVEHSGPGMYDEPYIDYVIEMLRKFGEHNLYVIMDPHQDVWSRFSGGSGAPYWTFLAAGLDPRSFSKTQAALVHNTSVNPKQFPRMIWSTNYERMAAATMFALFYAGRHVAPKALLNGENIQDYLQSHFINAMSHVAKRICEAGDLVGRVVIGWETMNEPSMSWLGCQDLGVIPKEQHLRKGTCPTPFQAMATGAGLAQKVEVWEFGSTGPRKRGTQIVDPEGISIWFDEKKGYDTYYKWKRGPDWRLGTCLWEQHGVWSSSTGHLLKPDYFLYGPDGMKIDDAKFLEHFFMPHFRAYKAAIREPHNSAIIFCQPPVLKIPPIFNDIDRKDSQIVYTPHYYDGLTLMNKTWNTWYNVDVLGVLRGRYRSPILALKFGLRAIRNCLRDQLKAIREEGLQNLGEYPCLISEIGIPFDLDNKAAYENDDYTSQIGALDANQFALEGAGVHFTFWHYSSLNTHKWGDFWNGEDLSFHSNSRHEQSSTSPSTGAEHQNSQESTPTGTRAISAVVRPAPVRLMGTLESSGFDLKTKTFELSMKCSSLVAAENLPSVVYLPNLHYHAPNIEVSEGEVVWDATAERIFWWHATDSGGLLAYMTITEETPEPTSTRFLC